MKKILSVVLLLALAAGSPALATEMTPEEAMQRMMNCVSCRPYMEYPELGSSIRYDIFKTKTGFVSAFMLADESLVPEFRELELKTEASREEAMKIPPSEYGKLLCPFCEGMFALMMRGDVDLEEFRTHMGTVALATSDTKDGIEALHEYAEMAKTTSKLLDEAAAKMHEGHEQ